MFLNIFNLLFSLITFITLSNADTECPTINSSTIGDRRTNKNALRLVQYNVEWLFIDYYKSSDCPGNGCPWHTLNDAQTHLSYVSDVIKTLNPDIINLCEVEGCDELNLLVDSLENTNYKPYLKKGTDTSTGQNVGLLTKVDPFVSLYRTEDRYDYPIYGSNCGYTGYGTSGVSKHYITEYNFNGLQIAMIGVHFIAIPTDSMRCAQREAQAQVIQNVIYNYVSNGYEIIVIGDMNDYDAQVLDINSHIPKSQALEILKGLKGEKKGTYSLNNVAYRVNQEQRYSDWYDSDNNCATSSIKDFSMIDHILVSSNLNNKIINAYFYHGYSEYCGKMNSDHYPVVIDFQF
jgi:exonuclease III